MAFKSILKPEGSIVAGMATVGAVYSIYQLNVGPVSQAAATDSNHPALETSRKKAGYTALLLVGALTLLTKDANVGTLGAGTIVAMEISYRHAIMANPQTQKMQPPGTSDFQPAQNVIPISAQGQAA
jgi:hypothetical protein